MLQTDTPPALPVDIPSPTQALKEMRNLTFDEFLDQFIQSCVQFAIHLAVAIIVFYIGRFIIKRLYRFVGTILLRRRADPSLTTFILSTVKIILYFILIITVIGILGIETSSFLALFASAGVAIGMALSGTLQNFAGGVLILLLKPYKVGDYIEALGYAGTVAEIQIFHTLITTPDNKAIFIPNVGLSTSSINNWSARGQRRISWNIAISYGDDVEAARQAIMKIFSEEPRILQGSSPDMSSAQAEAITAFGDSLPSTETAVTGKTKRTKIQRKPGFFYRLFHNRRRVESAIARWNASRTARLESLIPKVDFTPKVVVSELADSSVNLSARAWVNTPDYWNVFYLLNERFYTELPKAAGISFPFPQMDVHIQQPTT